MEYCRYSAVAGRAAAARSARREPRHLAGLRRAVLGLAGAEPSAGLRRRLPRARPGLPAARRAGGGGSRGRGAGGAGGEPGAAAGPRPAARPHRGADRDRAPPAARRQARRAAVGIGGHRRAGGAARAPPAARRPAGRPGQARQGRFRRLAFSPASWPAPNNLDIGNDRDGLRGRRGDARRGGAARDHSPAGRGGRDLVLLGDAAAAGRRAATGCMRSMPSAARSTTSPTTPARPEKAGGARGLARGDRGAL